MFHILLTLCILYVVDLLIPAKTLTLHETSTANSTLPIDTEFFLHCSEIAYSRSLTPLMIHSHLPGYHTYTPDELTIAFRCTARIIIPPSSRCPFPRCTCMCIMPLTIAAALAYMFVVTNSPLHNRILPTALLAPIASIIVISNVCLASEGTRVTLEH